MSLILAAFSLLPPMGDSLREGGRLAGREPDRVGAIYIAGNTLTADWVIRKQLQLCPGQILSYPELKRAEMRLAGLGIFDPESPPRIVVQPGQKKCVYKDILITVKETRTGQVSVGANVNNDPKK
jgi:outer membrane protein assembly factor BamA